MPGSFIGEVLQHILGEIFTEILKPVARVTGRVLVELLTFGKVRVAKFPAKKQYFARRDGYLEIHPDIATVLGAVVVIAALFGVFIWAVITFFPPRDSGASPKR